MSLRGTALKPMPTGNLFPAVRKAREALKARANDILEGYLKVIQQAAAAGDFETAAKGYQFLLEHMPSEEGTSLIDTSVDKKQVDSAKQIGPTINIGLAIGGINKALPASTPEVIDVTDVSTED